MPDGQSSFDKALPVIEFVVSMITAMLYGGCPPAIAASAVAERVMLRMPTSPPNHKFTLAVCVTLTALHHEDMLLPVQTLPEELAFSSQKTFKSVAVDEQKNDTVLSVAFESISVALYAPEIEL